MRLRAPARPNIAVTLACAVAWVATGARAQDEAPEPVRATLEWTAADGCLDSDALVAAVEARLSRSVFVPARRGEVRIRGAIAARPGGGFAASLALIDGAGEVAGRRTLESEAADCHALDESLALVVALLVDVDRRDIRLAVQAPPAGAAVVLPTLDPELASTPPPPPPLELRAWASGGVLFGFLPDAAGAVAVGFEVSPLPALGIDVSAELQLPATREDGVAGASVWSWTVGAALCALVPRVPLDGSTGRAEIALEVDLCAGASGGALHVEPTGLEPGVRADRALVAFSAGARGGVRIGAFFVRVELGARVPLTRDRFTYGLTDGTRAELLAIGDAVLTAVLSVGAVLTP